jgi:hypothetical protein
MENCRPIVGERHVNRIPSCAFDNGGVLDAGSLKRGRSRDIRAIDGNALRLRCLGTRLGYCQLD